MSIYNCHESVLSDEIMADIHNLNMEITMAAEFPSSVESLDTTPVMVWVETPVLLELPYGLTPAEEEAYVYAHTKKKLQSLIKSNSLHLNYTSQHVDYMQEA
jgi:hypothetical protein